MTLAAISPLTRADLPWLERILDRPNLAETLFGEHLDPFHIKVDESAFLLGNRLGDTAYLSYIYVSEGRRRRGIGGQLVAHVVEESRGAGLRRVLVSGETGKAPGYLQPGIEIPQQAGALALLTGLGFQELAKAYAMSIDLRELPDQPRNNDWQVSRATESDRTALSSAIAKSVPGEWERIFANALTSAESKVIVVRKGEAIGGYCHFRGDRFGPIGVLTETRGSGLGTMLTIAALHEMRSLGASSARFTWSDEANLSFYQRIGFKVERCFQRMELLL